MKPNKQLHKDQKTSLIPDFLSVTWPINSEQKEKKTWKFLHSGSLEFSQSDHQVLGHLFHQDPSLSLSLFLSL